PSSTSSARPPTGPDWPSTPNSTPTTTPKASKSPTSRSTRYGSPTTSFMANGTTHFAPNIAEQPTHCKGYFVPIPNALTQPLSRLQTAVELDAPLLLATWPDTEQQLLAVHERWAYFRRQL